jgi:hypothetical protein
MIIAIFYLLNENFMFNILPNFIKSSSKKMIKEEIDNE